MPDTDFAIAALEEEFLTAAQVAGELGMSTDGVYKLISRGKLKAVRRSERNVRVPRLALDAYLRRLNNQPRVTGELPESPTAEADVLAALFSDQTGSDPESWLNEWRVGKFEDTVDNAKLVIAAMLLHVPADGGGPLIEDATRDELTKTLGVLR